MNSNSIIFQKKINYIIKIANTNILKEINDTINTV